MKPLLLLFAGLIVVAVASSAWLYGTFNFTGDEHTPGGFSQQTVGESKAGQLQDMPASEAADRADTGESGKRAQTISSTGTGEAPLSPEQNERVRAYFKSN